MEAPHTPFARWRSVVGVLAGTVTVSWGLLFYAFGVLVPAMHGELGWSLTFLGAAFSLALATSALLAVPVGRALERHGPRGVMAFGSACGTLALLLWSHVERPWAFLGVALLLGTAQATCLYEAGFTAIVGCLGPGRRTDLALLTVTIVAGLASTIFVPLTQQLVSLHGWRAALRVLALLLATTTFLPHLWVLRGAPGRAFAHHESPTPKRRGLLTVTAMSFGLGILASTAIGVFLVALLREQGHDARFAALAAGTIGIGQVLGRIGFTALRLRLSLPAWGLLLFFLPSLALLLLLGATSRTAVLIAVVLFFGAGGAQTLARARWALDLFAPAAFARVNAVLGLSSQLGRAAAPLAFGALHDATGSHRAGLVFLAALGTVAGLGAAWSARRARG